MSYWSFKTFNEGLLTVFREYQIIAIRYLWDVGEEGAGSGKVWLNVNKILLESGKSISRASIIFYLNDMVDMGVLAFRDATGKGGHHRIYYPLFDEEGFKEHLARVLIEKLMQEFSDETKRAMWKAQRGRE